MCGESKNGMSTANQRTRTAQPDASDWIYQYDTLGQVTSGKHFWSDGTPVAGQQFEYGFDDIGNRQSAAHVGQASNLPVRAASLPPVPASDVRDGYLGTRGTDAPQTGRQGCLPHIGGSNLRLETYTANDLNQYTQRTVPGFAEV